MHVHMNTPCTAHGNVMNSYETAEKAPFTLSGTQTPVFLLFAVFYAVVAWYRDKMT